jgi:hypothetical protein
MHDVDEPEAPAHLEEADARPASEAAKADGTDEADQRRSLRPDPAPLDSVGDLPEGDALEQAASLGQSEDDAEEIR